jgi:hypothetical protein
VWSRQRGVGVNRPRLAGLVAVGTAGAVLAVANVHRWMELENLRAAASGKPPVKAEQEPKGRSQVERCKQNLAKIYGAIEAYRRDSGGDYPWALAACAGSAWETPGSLYPKYISDKSVFVCPGDETGGAEFPACRDVPCSYWYLLGNILRRYPEVDRAVLDKLVVPFGGDLVVLACVGNHRFPAPGVPSDSQYLVLRADGRIGWLAKDDRLFSRMRNALEEVSRLTERVAQKEIVKARQRGNGGSVVRAQQWPSAGERARR